MELFRLLDLTLPRPVENLALDEALLEELDERGGAPMLRFWESDELFVVLGRGSRADDEVDLAACQRDGVQILRRASGGGTVLQGPGCLSYAIAVPYTLYPELRTIRTTNRVVLERIAAVLQRWEPKMTFQGISDLAIGNLKISGNAQRRTRNALLFHGTILHRMSADLVAQYLKHPSRQPDYRLDRSHRAFLGMINVPPAAIKQAIASAWNAVPIEYGWPISRMPHAIEAVLARSQAEPLNVL